MSTPNITPAQVLSLIVGLIGVLVSQGLVDNGTGKEIGGIASIVIPAAWQVADAIIRHGRAKVAAAQATAAASVASAEAWRLARKEELPKPAPRSRSRAKKAA